ncbi:uncharacterized protein [Rutidosis leptorrhynchoides]|uniref:uncharacterized protein n=1 Tax=Rutidosis leptorrhynchoides TaxID=125765 RepID=UPI003A993FE0
MNLFESILSDDHDPHNPNNYTNNQQTVKEHTDSNSTFSGEISATDAGLWSFGDLVKTITTRSESILETYRRDLKEFGSRLKKESDLFREVGASAIDVVIKSTKDVILEPSGIDDSESVPNLRMYNRFDSQLKVIQSDVRTYCEEPDDVDEYNKWKLGFVLDEMRSGIEKLIGSESENEIVETIYKKVVPSEVDEGSFWCRYFYKVYKLKQQEEIRAIFMKRSLSVDETKSSHRA